MSLKDLLASAVLAGVAFVVVASTAVAQERPVTLEQAVKAALDHSPKVKIADIAVEKAGDTRKGAIGPMVPNLTLDMGVQYWDAATKLDFLGKDMPTDAELKTAFEPLAAFMPEESKPTFEKLMTGLGKMRDFQVQDQLTASITVQAVQPLTPLISLASVYRAYGAAEDAAKLEVLSERNNIAFEVSELFFQLMSARRMTEVARLGVEQVEAHLKMARSFLKAEMVGRDDVLRAETVLAEIKAQYDKASYMVELVRAALNVKMGNPPGDMIVPAGDYPDDPPQIDISEEEAVERALASRPEKLKLQSQVKMAEAGRMARIGQLVPTIAAVFRYTWFTGSEFQRENSAFVGAVLQWDFWNMGQKYFEMKAAEKDKQMAMAGLDMARDLITLDVKKAFIDLKSARSQITSFKKAIESAEENLRVVQKKYEAATATSVELFDAQSALNLARGNLAVAVNSYYIAYSNLQRALAGSI